MSLLVSIIKPLQSCAKVGFLPLMLLFMGCNTKKVESFDLIVSTLSPALGPTTGSTSITIIGSGLTYIESVEIGGVACTGLSIINDAQATCVTAASDPGVVDLVATNTIGKTATATFTYEVVPVVDSITPEIGSQGGGDLVTISGSGFSSDAVVKFDGIDCLGTSVLDSNTITCTTPDHSARSPGYVKILVTNGDGKSTEVRVFAFRNEPTVTSVEPSGGRVQGGTFVTVTGTGFSVGAAVTFNGNNCNFVLVTSSSTLTCLTPDNTIAGGPVDVAVTNNTSLGGVGLGLYTYRVAPQADSIDVTSGFVTGGTTITISGFNFLDPSVKVGLSTCTIILPTTANSITCTTTAHLAGAEDVVVTNGDGQVNTESLINPVSPVFTYVAAPVILSISPNSGISTGGTAVTITGTGFATVGVSTVDIGGLPCIVDPGQTATSLTCTTTGTTVGLVSAVITNPDTQTTTTANAYTYRGVPTVTSVSAASGPASGTLTVNVNGTGFTPTTLIEFDIGIACGEIAYQSAVLIKCKPAAHASGAVRVTAINDDGQTGFLNAAYTYQDAPTILSIDQTRGVPSGGTDVDMVGTGFLAGIKVFVGTVEVPVIFGDDENISFTTPANPVGPTAITVTNLDGQSASLPTGFNYMTVILDWDITSLDHGDSSTDLTARFTLTNSGEAAASPIVITQGGTDPSSWDLGTGASDTCTGNPLPIGDTCIVDVTFLGGSLGLASYSSTLIATSSGTLTQTANLAGTVVDAQIDPSVASVDHGSTAAATAPVTVTFTNIGADSTTALSINLSGVNAALWEIDPSSTCSVAPLAAGAPCDVNIIFRGDLANPASTNTATLSVSANAGGSAVVALEGDRP